MGDGAEFEVGRAGGRGWLFGELAPLVGTCFECCDAGAGVFWRGVLHVLIEEGAEGFAAEVEAGIAVEFDCSEGTAVGYLLAVAPEADST